MTIDRKVLIHMMLAILLTLRYASAGDAVVPVPSDPHASYYVVDLMKNPGGTVEITTRREGPSGISYAKRLVNCPSGTAKYLGEGDTLDDVHRARPDEEFWELCCGSISAYVSFQVALHKLQAG